MEIEGVDQCLHYISQPIEKRYYTTLLLRKVDMDLPIYSFGLLLTRLPS